MKKKLTRVMAVLLLLALVLVPFASCSSGTENASGDKDASAEGGQNTADAAADPEADAAADAEDAPEERGGMTGLEAQEHEAARYSVVIEAFAGVVFYIGL